MNKLGVLLVSLGTPKSCCPKDIREFLKNLLLDKNIVSLPRLIWLPILFIFILPFRTKKLVKRYQSIWGKTNTSPMLTNLLNLKEKLQNRFTTAEKNYKVEIGLAVATPSVKEGIEQLKQAGYSEITLLPLYPQSSSITHTGLKTLTNSEISIIPAYFDHPLYIQALVNSIKEYWAKNTKGDYLLFSFHNIPVTRQETPLEVTSTTYKTQCETTAHLVAKSLGLDANYAIVFQSKFGFGRWLEPEINRMLFELFKDNAAREDILSHDNIDSSLSELSKLFGIQLDKNKLLTIENIDIICPGFSLDCLETLEEIAIRYKKYASTLNLKLNYIPALNDRDDFVTLLEKLVDEKIATITTLLRQ